MAPYPLRVYRIPFSTNVERVALALAHKGVAVEWVDVDPFDGHALVGQRERHTLDVRRERDPVDAERVGRHGGTLPAAISYSVYSGQCGAEASNAFDVSCVTARSASIRPWPKHSS